MSDHVNCFSCRKIKARFDDHPKACYNCQGCSRLNKCVVCAEWPKENWDTLVARAERRKRSKDMVSAALGAPPTKKGRSLSKSPVILPSVSPSTCLKTSSHLPSLPPDLPKEETSPDLGSQILSQLSVLTASLAAQNARMDALEQVTQRGGGRLAQQPDHFPQLATGAPIESVGLRTVSGFSQPETLRADYPVLAESTYDSLHIA